MTDTSAQPGSQDRPAPACGCCRLPLYPAEAASGRTECRRCEGILTERLREIARLWELLPAAVEKGSPRPGPRTSGGGGGGSPAPGNLAAINLLAGDVTTRLRTFEDDWNRAFGWPIAGFRGNEDQTFTSVMDFLRRNLHGACHQPNADVHGLSGELRRLQGQMTSAVTGERDPRVTLPYTCPDPPPDDPAADPCGGRMRMDPRIPEIRCSTCGRETSQLGWLDLRRRVEALQTAAAGTDGTNPTAVHAA